MRLAVLLLLLLETPLSWAQKLEGKIQRAAIRIAKAALISNFDNSLPRISLEYFLDYEAAGAPVVWEATACPLTSQAANADAYKCVLATVEFRDGRVAMVSVAVGMADKRVELRSVMITDENGAVRKLPLIELPAAIQRMWRKMPRPEYSSDVPA